MPSIQQKLSTISVITVSSLLLTNSFADTPSTTNQDSIIFRDGGNLYGKFNGLAQNGDILWSRDGAENTQQFPSKEISQITINGGRPREIAPSGSYIELVNGNSLPGKLISLSDSTFKFETSYSDTLEISKEYVRAYHPSPDGETLLINGFDKNSGWVNSPLVFSLDVDQDSSNADQWELHGASWYGNSRDLGVLHNPEQILPDDFVIKFEYAYQGSPSLNIALHADMDTGIEEQDEPDEKEGSSAKEDQEDKAVEDPDDDEVIEENDENEAVRGAGIANTFGNTLNLTVGPSYNQLSVCGVNKDSNTIFTSRQRSNVPKNYPQRVIPVIDVEIRVSKTRNRISLFLDEEHAGEWSINEDIYPKNGDKLCFFSQGGGDGNIRISNLQISKWHGVLDNPKSMTHEDKDIVLLTNNTDRIASSKTNYEDNLLNVNTPYSSFKIPEKKIKSIFFSTNNLKEINDDYDSFQFHFFQRASVTGKPISTSEGVLSIQTIHSGMVSVPIDQLRSISLEEVTGLIESWSNKH